MFMKSLFATTLITVAFAAPALAGPVSHKKLNKIEKRLSQLEYRGVIKQGSRLDHIEDRIDRREDRRDRAVNHGPLDRLEDRLDRRENRWDRRR